MFGVCPDRDATSDMVINGSGAGNQCPVAAYNGVYWYRASEKAFETARKSIRSQ